MAEPKSSQLYVDIRESLQDYVSDCISKFLCSHCNEPLNECRRIPTCGHCLCYTCLNLDTRLCTVCKEPFDLTEVEEQDTVNKFMDKIQHLKELLEEDKIRTRVPDPNQAGPSGITKHKNKKSKNGKTKGKKHVEEVKIVYQDIQFCITFIESLEAKRNDKGETPLHKACKKSDLDKVGQLINEGADLNAKDFAGWVPLHEAIQIGAEDIVKLLIEKGALINIPGPEYTTPLHLAVTKGFLGIIKFLVAQGADLDAIDYTGKKPMDIKNQQQIAEAIEEVSRVDNSPVYQIRIHTTVTAYCHSIDDGYLQKLTANQNKSIKVKKVFNIEDSTLTHLIVKTSHDISCKILLAIAAGIYVVPQEYIDRWIKGEFHLPLDPNIPIIKEEETNEGIRRSMLNKILGRPKLFDGIKFFISGHKNFIKIGRLNVNKTFLGVLIKAGGGEVLHRAPASRVVDNLHYPYHCANDVELKQCSYIIIFEENKPPVLQYKMPELKHRSSHWLIKTVMRHNLADAPSQNELSFM